MDGKNMNKIRILLAEDNADVRELLANVLSASGYDVVCVGNGFSGMTEAERCRPALIISDVLMPDMDGFQFCQTIKNHDELHNIPFIFYTATYVNEEDRELARAVGASRFIVKQSPIGDLLQALRDTLRDYEQHTLDIPKQPLLEEVPLEKLHDQVLEHKLYHKVEQQELERNQSEARFRKVLVDVLTAISRAVAARDAYTEMHQIRTSQLARCIAHEMHLDAETADGIRLCAAVHDLGKLRLPSETLNKPGLLSVVERRLIQTHAQGGYDILKDIDFPWPVADVCLQHHERMDGSGYPNGLKGEDICLAARITAVADVVEAISHFRPWRPALSMDIALGEIGDGRGTLYCPDVVDATLALIRSGRFQDWDKARG